MKALSKLVLLAGAAYGGYYLYKKYVKQPQAEDEFEDLTDSGFDFDDELSKEESLADKVKAAANRQLDRIK